VCLRVSFVKLKAKFTTLRDVIEGLRDHSSRRNKKDSSFQNSMKLITLKFTSPFKVSGAEKYIDAITLYRAFINALSLLGESFDEIEEGKVKFSSTFPVKEGKLYLKIPFRTISCGDREVEKSMKGIEYVDADLFKKVKPPLVLECEGKEKYVRGAVGSERLDSSYFLTSHGKVVVEYKNRMDRMNNSADIYSISSFMPEHEMAFLATTWDYKLDKALKLLERTGLGKERNLGYGRFVVKSVKDYDLTVGGEYKYVTGRAYTEGEFLAENFDTAHMLGGDVSLIILQGYVLLPVGSLVKNTKRIYDEREGNVVIVDPITL